MRRILIVPLVSSSDVTEDRSFQELYEFTEKVVEFGDDAFFYMVIPPWIRDGLHGHERLHYLHAETTRDAGLNDTIAYSAHNLAAWFARRGGRFVVDAVVTNCVQFSLQLAQFMSDPSREPVPVFLRDSRRHHIVKKQTSLFQLSSALNLASGRLGVVSEYHQKDVVEFLGQFVMPRRIQCFLDHTFAWPWSNNLDYLDGCRKRANREDKQVIGFVGGDPAENGMRKVLPVFRKLFVLGSGVMVASVKSASKVKQRLPDKDVSYIMDIQASLPWDVYYMEAAKAHYFISTGQTEEEFFDELQRMVLGQVGIFPYKNFISEQLGSDYPFMYNDGDTEEAFRLAAWVVENYKDAVEHVLPYVDRIRKRISREVIFRSVWRHMTDVIDSLYHVTKMPIDVGTKRLPLFNSVQKIAEGLGEEFAMQVFLDILEETVTWLKPWGQKGTLQILGRVKNPLPTLYDIRELLDNLGWIDLCNGPEIMFLKMRDPRQGVFDA